MDPDETLIDIAAWNTKFDDLKISLDVDPRRMSSIGFSQAGDALSKLSEAEYLQSKEEETINENKQEDASGEPNPGSDQ